MLTVIALYILAGAVVLLIGMAAEAAVHSGFGLPTTSTLPLGGAAALAVLYPLGYLLPTQAAGPILLSAAAATIIVSFAGRVRSMRSRRQRHRSVLPRIDRADVAVLGWAYAAGGVFLAPIFALGAPTTAAVSVFDGWARAVLSGWVYANPTSDAAKVPPDTLPLGGYSSPPPELALGLEHLTALVMSVTGRASFELAAIVAALSVPIAACGWACLVRALGGRYTCLTAPVIATGGATPTAAFLFADSYLTQLLALGFAPYAAAAVLAFGERPTVRLGVLAAAASLAVIGTYPPLLPWAGPLLLAAYLIGAFRRTRRPVRIAAPAAFLAAALTVVGFLQIGRAVSSVNTVGGLRSNEEFPLFSALTQVEIALGARSPFSQPPFSMPGVAVPAGIVVVVVIAAAVIGVVGAAGRGRREVAVLMAAVVLPTAALGVHYGTVEEYGYGVVKAMASGGTLLCGLIVTSLLTSARGRWAPSRHMFAAVCVPLWLLVSAQTVAQISDRDVGFRERDLAFRTQLQALPPDSVVLFEGVSRGLLPFQTRAIAGYFSVTDPGPRVIGLGTAPTYMSGGGSGFWRPQEPWDFVVRSEPTVSATNRSHVWSSDAYHLSRAPSLDITPYGTGWGEPVTDETGTTAARITGRADMIVANRLDVAVRAVITFRLTSPGRAQAVTVAGDGRARSFSVGPESGKPAEFSMTLEPRSTGRLTIVPSGKLRGEEEPVEGAALGVQGLRVHRVDASDALGEHRRRDADRYPQG
ncbi:MAG: hypothetical protein ACF8LK_09875 [Phycisphaerales bacterium JB041]